MVERMRVSSQQDATVLKLLYKPRWLRHMSPLVNLIRHRADGQEGNAKRRQVVLQGRFQRNQRDADQAWQCQNGHVAIGIDKSTF